MRRSILFRLSVIVFAMLVAVLACSLSGSPQNPTPTRIPLLTLSPTITFVILTPTASPTGAAVATAVTLPPTQINCRPQTGWPIYTVVAGDTLGGIAQRSGTTAAQLATANCLANPELIFVGQRLYVPVLPAQPTPVPTSATGGNRPIFQQNLVTNPYYISPQGRYITNTETVRVEAGEVLEADRVAFFVNDPTGGSAIAIGEDRDPWDGAFVDYDFPAPGDYTFQAVAYNEQAQANSTIFSIRYDPNFVPIGGVRNLLAVTPYVRIESGWVVVTGNTTITVSWPDAPVGATRVDFTMAPTGTGMEPQVIGSDLNPADGSSIAWNVPAGITAILQASATMPDESTQMSEMLNIISEG